MKLKFSFVFFYVVLLTSPAWAVTSTAPSDAQIVHLLNRISFGPAPGDIETVRQTGLQDYIEQQLHPERLRMPFAIQQRIARLPTVNASMTELMDEYQMPEAQLKALPEDERKEVQRRKNEIIQELAEAKILRAAASPAQLQEVMVDFWFNHFNVFAEKGLDKIFISSYERDAIRPYVLGKFSDLLAATAHHPAMLFYLDNWLNTDPDSPIARGKKIGINENYAREIMELHTLGVNGGYTQTDVTTLAHVLTGWGLGEGKNQDNKAEFYFEPRRHDYSNQRLLGDDVRGGGEEEIEHVLDMLVRHPATGQHIAYELAQYFVADEPPPGLVQQMAATFRSSGGDIAAVLRIMFYSSEFWDAHYTQNKFKPPFRYVVSALRANGVVPPGDTKMLQGAIGQMGEPLYRCLTPNGYSNTNDQWLNSDALLKRIDFAKNLSHYLDKDAPQYVETSLGNIWSANTLHTVQNADVQQKLILLLGSPEFVSH